MKMRLIFLAGLSFLAGACNRHAVNENADPKAHPEWSRNSSIYEVNIRQFTPEGTLNAFANELPRLKKMGVDILWLMPVNPVGEKNRKGKLGSYYSVRDYKAVNPEFGTMDDFKALVTKAHELGMKVIIDWVANHTAWDNDLITKQPDWYKKDSTGKIIPPVPDWTDVAALDYSKPELRDYMTEAMLFWIREADIDGFRCDVAAFMPVSFWNKAIPELKKVKPVFMLAEAEGPKMHDSGYFDATYAWNFMTATNDIARGKKPATVLDSLYRADTAGYPSDAYRMRFTSNHDENSWNGTEYERLGEGARTFAVLSFTFPGIPMIYTGQESANNKRLKFFEKDTIDWRGYPLESFYSVLLNLRHRNPLIASGDSGGAFVKIPTDRDKAVYAFVRTRGDKKLFVILNLSDTDQPVTLQGNRFAGQYKELFTGQQKEFKGGDRVTLTPWQYLVFE